MSMDLQVFLKETDRITSIDFDFYTFTLGYQLRINPRHHIPTHTGFLQFNLRASFLSQVPYDSLLTGFEICFSPYRREDYDEETARRTEGSTQTLLMTIDGEDSFQELVAALFAAYLCKLCGGILYDPQKDVWCNDVRDLEAGCAQTVAQLKRESAEGRLRCHRFRGWS